jgi:DNA end-binding protein Ku
LPSRKRSDRADAAPEETGARVRPLWSGTITFGLVSIPVELVTAVRPRQTAMKLVDKSGHALGREYHCSKEDRKLTQDELVRGYLTDSGKMVVITDAEFESVAPEMSGDIELRNFVPLEQIPPIYFNRPYFLAPSGKSTKAYHLLTATMEKAGRVGIGSFVMRGHEYLVAIIADNGVLRADTLRYADEIRTPEAIGLTQRGKATASRVSRFAKVIEDLTRTDLDLTELQDEEAKALERLAETKRKEDEDVIHQRGLEQAEGDEGGAKIIDLMAVLRKSLSKNAVVKTAGDSAPISLDERRAERVRKPAGHETTSRKRKGRRSSSKRKAAR